MKIWTMMAIVTSFVLGSACTELSAAVENGDGHEKIVTHRKKKKQVKKVEAEQMAAPVVAPVVVIPAVVAVPAAVLPSPDAAPSDDEAAGKPPPPPEPPAVEASEPRRLVRYFCKAWKDEEWERLWWAMTPKYRKNVSLKKFKTLFIDDAETNGGLKDENIVEVSAANSGVAVKVELMFKFRNAKSRVVNAVVERIAGGQYRMTDSAILPVDLNDL